MIFVRREKSIMKSIQNNNFLIYMIIKKLNIKIRQKILYIMLRNYIAKNLFEV